MEQSRWKRVTTPRRRKTIRAGTGLAAAAAGLALLVTGAAAQNSTPPAGTSQPATGSKTPPASGSSTQNPGQTSPAGTSQPSTTSTQDAGQTPSQDDQRRRDGSLHIQPTLRSGRGRFGDASDNASGGFGRRAGTFSFEFRGSDIDNVLKFFSQISGMTITKDASLTGSVTILSPSPITLDDAFKVLQSVLNVRGFTALPKPGNVLSIESIKSAVPHTGFIGTNLNANNLDPRNPVTTQIIPLQNVDAVTMAKDLQPLVDTGGSLVGSAGTNDLILTDSATNVQRFIDLISALDKTASKTEMVIYPLHHADAQVMADLINNLYKQLSPSRGQNGQQQGRGGGGPFGGGGGPQPNGQQDQQASGLPAVVAEADTHTNSVIVVASPDIQEQIKTTLLNKLDEDAEALLGTQSRKIQYASAIDVANTVNTVLSNKYNGFANSSQSGGSPFQRRAFGGGFGGGGFFGGGFGGGGFGGGNSQTPQVSVQSSDPLAQVAADARTNMVIITASPERMIDINKLIDELDVPIVTESTTIFIPLKNAPASVVAQVLNSAFSSTQSGANYGNIYNFGGGGSGSSTGNNGLTRQPIQRQLGTTSSTAGGRSVMGHGPILSSPGLPPGGITRVVPQPLPQGVPASGISGTMTQDGNFVPDRTPDDPNAADPNSDPTRQVFRGFGGGFGGFGGGGQNTTPTYGPSRTGTYSNLSNLTGNVVVTPSPDGSGLIVTTPPANFQAVQQIVNSLDVIPRQVMIEAVVAEVSLSSDGKQGLSLGSTFQNILGHSNTLKQQFNLFPQGLETTFDPLAAGGQLYLNSTNYSSLLQAITTDSRVKVLSTPRVFTSNNQQAQIQIVTEQPFINGQTVGTGTTTNNISNSVEFANIGIILNVTPTISQDGLVTIDVQQETSDLVNFDTLGTGASAIVVPVIDDRYTDTEVLVQSGETVAIGGLISDSKTINVTKIPVLSDIPLLGQFFRAHETVRNKVELLIFLTPHVITSPEQARAMTIQQGNPVVQQLNDLQHQDLGPGLNQTPPVIFKPTPMKQPAPTQPQQPAAPTQPDLGGTSTAPSDSGPSPLLPK